MTHLDTVPLCAGAKPIRKGNRISTDGTAALGGDNVTLFGNDGGGDFVAYEATTGNPLWHAGLGNNTTNGPSTFLLDGRQYVVVGAGDQLFAFTLQP